jgi:hypothetical protein
MTASGFASHELCPPENWPPEGMVERHEPTALGDTSLGPDERLWSDTDLPVEQGRHALPGLDDDDMGYETLHEPGNHLAHGIEDQRAICASGSQELLLEEQPTMTIGTQYSGPALPLSFPPLDRNEFESTTSKTTSIHQQNVVEGSRRGQDTDRPVPNSLRTRSTSRAWGLVADTASLIESMDTSTSPRPGKKARKLGASPKTESRSQGSISSSQGSPSPGESSRRKNPHALARKARGYWEECKQKLRTSCSEAKIQDPHGILDDRRYHIGE